jgi:hypothetical protein
MNKIKVIKLNTKKLNTYSCKINKLNKIEYFLIF